MTDIFKEPGKNKMKRELMQLAISSLEKMGWQVEKIAGSGKSSVRRIVKGNDSKTISIRTSQDTWIAFPRNDGNDAWATLAGVDYVIAASVDRSDNPQFAQIHMIPGTEMRERFDRAYEARKKAGHSLPKGRGMWVSLYYEESNYPVNRVGAGVGLEEKYLIARAPIKLGGVELGRADPNPSLDLPRRDVADSVAPAARETPHLTIPDAKRLLALSLGVSEADIRITING